jgi:hypothetical protein
MDAVMTFYASRGKHLPPGGKESPTMLKSSMIAEEK